MRSKKKQTSSPSRYALYERAVQSPEVHLELFLDFWKKLRSKKRTPLRLREDFCGSFAFACEWVKSHPERRALGIDLDQEVLVYGVNEHMSRLTPEAMKRLDLKKQDVRRKTTKQDMIVACNFSFCVFKKREELKAYFRSVRNSLDKEGVFILEHAGGPGMIEKLQEKKQIRWKQNESFTYIWDQVSFDPISCEGRWAIHFKGPGKLNYPNAFEYDWRLWSLPEIREILLEAGFQKSVVYWEKEHRGRGTGEYYATERGTNDHSWVTYLVALR